MRRSRTRYAKLRARAEGAGRPEGGHDRRSGQAVAAAHPDSFVAQMALGEALAADESGCGDRRLRKGRGAIPNVPGEDSPYSAIAALAIKKGDKARAVKALETLISYSHTDVASARQLVTLLDPKDAARMQTALKRVVSVDPFDGQAHTSVRPNGA